MINILRLIPAGLFCFFIGVFIWRVISSSYIDELRAEIFSLNADLRGQRAARREQVRKYDELYDKFFRLSQTNSMMAREVQIHKNTYEEAADEAYALFLNGTSRKDLCKLFPKVAYSTICYWIRKKRKEATEWIDPMNSKQQTLI